MPARRNSRITLIILLSAIFTLTANFAKALTNPNEPNDLEITSAEECLKLGGKWDACPPNECQQSEAYQKGEVMCPQVCGQPRCEGLVPANSEDFSQIHNVNLDHQPTLQENSNSPDFKKEESTQTAKNEALPGEPEKTSPSPNNNQASIKKNELMIYLTLGLILLLIFVIIKYKGRLSTQKK